MVVIIYYLINYLQDNIQFNKNYMNNKIFKIIIFKNNYYLIRSKFKIHQGNFLNNKIKKLFK